MQFARNFKKKSLSHHDYIFKIYFLWGWWVYYAWHAFLRIYFEWHSFLKSFYKAIFVYNGIFKEN